MPLLELGDGGPLMPLDRETYKKVVKRYGGAKKAGKAISDAYLPPVSRPKKKFRAKPAK